MSERRPRLGHRVEHALLRAVAGVGVRLDERRADRLGTHAGRLAYRLGMRREKVHENLRRAFPQHADAWVRATGRACYEHLGREGLATLRMSHAPAGTLRAACETHGLDQVRRALAQHGGAVVVSGHLGNWELGAAAFPAHDIPVLALAQRQANRLFDDELNAARARLGIDVVDRRRATRPVLEALRSGRVVFFASDQNAGRAGVFVPFFGRPASTHRGAALFAIRTGSPLLLACMTRRATGDSRYVLRLERVAVNTAGELEESVLRLTAAFTARLEEAVKAAPEQYFWHHRRWKTRPRQHGDSGAV